MNVTHPQPIDVRAILRARWVPYAVIAALLLALPGGSMWLYAVWSGEILRDGILQLMRMGVTPESMDKVPGWGLVFSVGRYGPVLLMLLITIPVWKMSARSGVHPWFGGAARALLGAYWAYILIA